MIFHWSCSFSVMCSTRYNHTLPKEYSCSEMPVCAEGYLISTARCSDVKQPALCRWWWWWSLSSSVWHIRSQIKCILVNEMCYRVYSVMVVILLQLLELFSTRISDDTEIRITVRLVGDVAQGDTHYMQVFNLLMRKCLGHLDLQLVGRNFFDAKAKVFHISALISISTFFIWWKCSGTI